MKNSSVSPGNNLMPVIFVGHGSPMNAIEENEFTRGWKQMSARIPRPRAVLCISAHWETSGTLITAMDTPETIHDFGGFPEELYKVQYPAPGNPGFAEDLSRRMENHDMVTDLDWGLDHGCWSVIRHFYPEADVPVMQVSLDYRKKPSEHYDLGKELAFLRREGILIVGSGNIVHNLRMIDWQNVSGGYDWAEEASAKIQKLVREGNHRSLIDFGLLGREVDMAVPSPEHYLPLLYVLALSDKKDLLTVYNDKRTMGSLSMTSFFFGTE